jgi:hypothetical protein
VSGVIGLHRHYTGRGLFRSRLPLEVQMEIERLPKDVVIACHPEDCREIPLLTRRSVLVGTQYLFPYHKKYFENMQRRLQCSSDALLANSWDELERLGAKCGFTHLLVGEQRPHETQSEWMRWFPTEMAALALSTGNPCANPDVELHAVRVGRYCLVNVRSELLR